jgi:hypothetical protein
MYDVSTAEEERCMMGGQRAERLSKSVARSQTEVAVFVITHFGWRLCEVFLGYV